MWKPIEWLYDGLLSSEKKVAKTIINPWPKEYNCAYITWFKKELELVATLLSESTELIIAHFNPKDNLVRFLNQRNEVIAIVKVKGDVGCATTAIVKTNLSDDKKEIFVKNIENLKDLENPQRPRRIKVYFEELDS